MAGSLKEAVKRRCYKSSTVHSGGRHGHQRYAYLMERSRRCDLTVQVKYILNEGNCCLMPAIESKDFEMFIRRGPVFDDQVSHCETFSSDVKWIARGRRERRKLAAIFLLLIPEQRNKSEAQLQSMNESQRQAPFTLLF